MQGTSHINGPGTKDAAAEKIDATQGTNNENHGESGESIDVISDENSENEARIDAGSVTHQVDGTCSRTLSGYSRLNVAGNALPQNTQQEQLSFMSSNIGDSTNGVNHLKKELSSGTNECINYELGNHVTNGNSNVTDSECISSSSRTLENSSSKPTGIYCVANIEGSERTQKNML